MNIRKKTTVQYFDDDTDQEYMFNPIEDTVSIEKNSDGGNGFVLKYLVQDDDPIPPDEWDDGQTFLVHYHRDFWIENKRCSKDVLGFIYTKNEDDYDKDGADELLEEYYCFPVSALIHSGVWLSLRADFYADPGGWDTSHVGAVLVKKKEFGAGGVEFEYTREEAETQAQALIKTWNQYLSGDVYCCVVEKLNSKKENIDYDRVWGFYGFDYAKECLQNGF